MWGEKKEEGFNQGMPSPKTFNSLLFGTQTAPPTQPDTASSQPLSFLLSFGMHHHPFVGYTTCN
jgi:hypothetical protein